MGLMVKVYTAEGKVRVRVKVSVRNAVGGMLILKR